MKKKLLWVLLACLVLVAAVTGVLLGVVFNTPEVPEEPVVEAEAVKLYWNVDRDAFVGDSSAGMTKRERDADGFYNIRFAVDGEQVTYKVDKARLVEQIDSMDIVGLDFDEAGVITQVYDPAEITGGEVVSMCYVLICGDTTITVSPDEALETDYQTFEINADTGIYNVTGMDPVGFVDTAITSDRIRAFQNEEGVLTHIFIVERFGYWPGETVLKYCEHCKTEVEWRVWEEKYALPTDSAHWILDNKVSAPAQHKVGANKELILDLNGYTITGPDSKRVYALTGENAFLAILDSSEKKTGAIVGSGSPDNGSVIYIRYGTFELYGGTIDASDIKTAQYASAVRVNTDCVFNMYGGTIIGGKVVAPGKDDTKVTNAGYGGTLYVTGTLNMYDGTITGGSCIESGGNIFVGKAGALNLYGGEVLSGTATKKGGNIAGTGKVNLYDCTVSGGTAKTYGGNIFVGKGGVVTLHNQNTVISDGTGKQGGNIYIEKGAGVVMKAGTIKSGSSKEHGGAVAVYGTFDVNGGQISGSTAKEQGGNIFVGKSGVLNMNSGSVVNGTAKTKGGNIAGTGKVKLTGGSVSGGSAKTYGGNLFGGKNSDVTISNAVISDGKAKQGGNLYHEAESTVRMNGGTIKNGKSTEHGGSVAIYGKFTFNSGSFSGGKAAEQGGNIFVGKSGQLTVSGGTVQGGEAGTKGGNIAGTGTIALKGGTVSGGSAKNGGNLFVSGTVTMENGCIKNGTAKSGGNVTVNGATWLMNGGTIENGTATEDGGCVYIARNVDSNGNTISLGSFTMNGGQITGGSCVRYGGNIFAGKECTLTVNGGAVLGGVATGNEEITSRGGNINVTGNIAIAGGIVSGGSAGNGGNIAAAGLSFAMSGGQIQDGTVTNQNQQDKNIFIDLVKDDQDQPESTFTISGGTVVGGVRIKNAEKAVLTGNAVIFTDKEDSTNLTLDEGMIVSLGELGENAKFGVNPKYTGYFATDAVESDKDHFTVDGGGNVLYEDGKLLIQRVWTKDSDNGKLPTKSGHYILGESFTVSDASTTEKNATIYLDMNGYTVTSAENKRVYVLEKDASLTIGGVNDPESTDSKQNTIIGNRTSDKVAGMIYLKGKGSAFTLKGDVTLDANGVKLTGSSGQGGAVYVAAGTTFNMEGGSIIGGTATQGGNVYVQAGTTPGTVNLSGGTIEKGSAGTAGNVCALGAMEMTGGTITGGTATGNATGGNVYTVPGKDGCTFTMTGGTIAGLVRVNSAGSVSLGGTAKIAGGATNLTLSDKPAKLKTTGFSTGAEISVNLEYEAYAADGKYFGEIGVQNDESFIKLDDGSEFEVIDGKLYQKKVENEDDDQPAVIDWTSTNSLPTEAGSYRLTENVYLETVATTSQAVELDLNGKTVDGQNTTQICIVDNGGVLTIKDTVGNGEIKGGKSTENGGSIYVKAGAQFHLYSGTITGGQATDGTGGNVYVQAATSEVTVPGKFYMYNGTVTVGKAKQGGNIYLAAGSATNAAAEVYLSGGTVSGGEGTATAGNVAALGVFQMTGGEITGGICNVTGDHKYAYNLYTLPGKNKCTFTMTGGTIAGGVRVNNDGSISLGGTAKIVGSTGTTGVTFSKGNMTTTGFSNGAEISVNVTVYGAENTFGTVGVAGDEQYIHGDDGTTAAVTEDGKVYLKASEEEDPTINWTSPNSLPTEAGSYRLTENVYLETVTTITQAVELDLNGKTIDGQNTTQIYIVDNGGVLTIKDTVGNGEIKGGKSTENGGSIYVKAGGQLHLYSGTITGGQAIDGTGGNVYVEAGTTAGSFVMHGGTLSGGKAKQGGNVYLAAGSTAKAAANFEMKGGTISGGEGTATAGNVAALGVFQMTGGEITGGICNVTGDHKYAYNLYTLPGKNKCTFTMTGGTIAGGVRVNNDGSISLGGTAKIVGSTGTTGVTFSKGNMTTSGFSAGAEISVNVTVYGVENSFGTVAAGDEQYIHGDNGSIAGVEDGKVYLIDPASTASLNDEPLAALLPEEEKQTEPAEDDNGQPATEPEGQETSDI